MIKDINWAISAWKAKVSSWRSDIVSEFLFKIWKICLYLSVYFKWNFKLNMLYLLTRRFSDGCGECYGFVEIK
jgi:hypothetical protein